MIPLPPISTLFPYTTLFRSASRFQRRLGRQQLGERGGHQLRPRRKSRRARDQVRGPDRKSTRLNSSHTVISYAVFCLKKKKKKKKKTYRQNEKNKKHTSDTN